MEHKSKKKKEQSAPVPYRFPTVYPTLTNQEMRSETDPQGSYTGNPLDGGVPVQDADDL